MVDSVQRAIIAFSQMFRNTFKSKIFKFLYKYYFSENWKLKLFNSNNIFFIIFVAMNNNIKYT